MLCTINKYQKVCKKNFTFKFFGDILYLVIFGILSLGGLYMKNAVIASIEQNKIIAILRSAGLFQHLFVRHG